MTKFKCICQDSDRLETIMEYMPSLDGYICKHCENFLSNEFIEDVVKPLITTSFSVLLPKIKNPIRIEKNKHDKI